MDPTHPSRTAPTQWWAVIIALSTFACGDGLSSHPARIYTGEVAETDVRVGIIATEHHARVFFCGGTLSYETMTRWLNSDIDAAHKLTLPSTPNQYWGLLGDVADTQVNGTVDMTDGIQHPFHATVVSDRTMAGLYEGTAPCGKLGLIVVQPTPDAMASGQGACVGPMTLQQVNPLDPIVRGEDGTIAVTVANWMGQSAVRAAAPPAD